ncbi:MAG: hypothetical protein GF390_03980, partial [Candidatus Pacebacteria bacterium]|nr:hypothetical protein [Candidatus Paceibacterota bacterium]
MTDAQVLVGSLSNDLFRVASLRQRGSIKAANRFLQEAKRWAEPLQKSDAAKYITEIAKDIAVKKTDQISMKEAEQ